MHKKFEHAAIEQTWQARWREEAIYETKNNTDKPKTYVLDMFPYPSGEGLHVGHPKGYIATDIYSRYKRMSGHEVLHPMGWDAFGLPAENFAIKHKVHPRTAVEKNIARFKDQLSVLGFDYDWSREINTTDPDYYKWTQWIFIELFNKGLAYESNEPINWCPGCQTGLANEDVEPDGTCERCDTPVEKKPMRQWVLKIRKYADRLLEDLDTLKWPEHIKEAQRQWIGKSEGAELDFMLSTGDTVTVFTTRPDTLFGATYMVLAPEHPLLGGLTARLENTAEVKAYIEEAGKKKEMDRLDETKEKTGVKLEGITATNPATNEQIPVFIADYVLASYGTGAIMAVPAHDERDYAFAKKYDLPVKQVVAPYLVVEGDDAPRSDEDIYDFKASTAIIKHWSEEKYYTVSFATGQTGFVGGSADVGETPEQTAARETEEESGYQNIRTSRLIAYQVSRGFKSRKKREEICRDHCVYVELLDEQRVEIKDEETKVGGWKTKEEILSDPNFLSHHLQFFRDYLDDRIHTGSGKLVASGDFTNMDSEDAKRVITERVGGRMTTTYKIRDWVFSRQRYWGEPIPIIHCEQCGAVPVPETELPVALPEVEHYEPAGDGQSPLAAIPDWVNTTCPNCGGAGKRETNTMPQWAGSSWYYLRFMDPHNSDALVGEEAEQAWAPVDVYVGGDHAVRHLIYARFWHKFLYDSGVVSTSEPFQRLEFLGFILAEDGRKMSKRWGNVINPDDIVKLVGADTLRVYEMFMGPFENTIAWSQDGVAGARRFLERVNGLSEHVANTEPTEITRLLHKTIKKVGDDIEAFKFNTAVSTMMIFLNHAEKAGLTPESYEMFLRVLAPFAPHLTEELWATADRPFSIHQAAWPSIDPELVVDDVVTIGVQFNGKVRGEIRLPVDASEDAALAALQADEQLAARLEEVVVDRIIYVPGKILNLVVSPRA